MNIVLGIFNGYFYTVANKEGNCSYPFTDLIGDMWVEFSDIVHTVYYASRRADKIIFIIDGLLPNINGTEDSFTCKELMTLLTCPFIPTSKIEFWDNQKIVTVDYIQNKLNLPKELFD